MMSEYLSPWTGIGGLQNVFCFELFIFTPVSNIMWSNVIILLSSLIKLCITIPRIFVDDLRNYINICTYYAAVCLYIILHSTINQITDLI